MSLWPKNANLENKREIPLGARRKGGKSTKVTNQSTPDWEKKTKGTRKTLTTQKPNCKVQPHSGKNWRREKGEKGGDK